MEQRGSHFRGRRGVTNGATVGLLGEEGTAKEGEYCGVRRKKMARHGHGGTSGLRRRNSLSTALPAPTQKHVTLSDPRADSSLARSKLLAREINLRLRFLRMTGPRAYLVADLGRGTSFPERGTRLWVTFIA